MKGSLDSSHSRAFPEIFPYAQINASLLGMRCSSPADENTPLLSVSFSVVARPALSACYSSWREPIIITRGEAGIQIAPNLDKASSLDFFRPAENMAELAKDLASLAVDSSSITCLWASVSLALAPRTVVRRTFQDRFPSMHVQVGLAQVRMSNENL